MLLPILLGVGSCAGAGDFGDAVLAPGAPDVSGETTDPSVRAQANGNVVIEEPVITDDGRMLQPAGHVGLWFETEPEDPLDHLVWVSQRYVGKPVPVKQLGEDALSPEGEHLPDVCASEIIQRMLDMGFYDGAGRDAGTNYVQCAVLGYMTDEWTDGISFFWGAHASVDTLSQGRAVSGVNEQGDENLTEGDLADQFGCLTLNRSFSSEGAIFSYSTMISDFNSCADTDRIMRVVYNSLGGKLVQV